MTNQNKFSAFFSLTLNTRTSKILLLSGLLAGCGTASVSDDYLVIEKQGSFSVGGTILGDALTSSQHCDHGYVDYQIPPSPREINLLMWHSASASGWQNRWDGGEGFQSIFLRRDYPVYLWDGPRVGRADWGCESFSYSPQPGMDQQNFNAWRLGVSYPDFFEGIQFPADDPEAWNQATRARYQEFDSVANAWLQAEAAAELVERIGPTVALTNSAGGVRALLTALKSDNIAGLIAYENVGYVFPEGEGPVLEEGPYGPVYVPLEEFMKLTRFPIQIIWGDNMDIIDRFDYALEQSHQFVELINKYGGDAEVIVLPEIGLSGNTHLPFADLNNVEVADLVSDFLGEKRLNSYTD